MDRAQGFENLWDNMFALAEEYYWKNHHLLIPHSYVINNNRLGAWISSQRAAYRENSISDARKEKLESIGMVWNVREHKWFQMYSVAKWYYEKHGDLMVPTSYVTPTGEKLGGWIAQQRKNYSRIKTEKENPLFTEEKIALLNEIEMIWDASNSIQRTSFPEQCIVYYASKAGLNFKNRVQFSGVEIDVLFPDFNIGLEYDGERWHKNVQRDSEKNRICHDAGLQLIRIREPKCPEISGSTNYILNGYSYSDLSSILHEMFLKHFGVDVTVNIEREHDLIIEQYITYAKQRWKDMVAILAAYKSEHGNLRIARDAVIDGYLVGSWIHDIRKRNKNGELFISKLQRKQLEDLGIVWDQYEEDWNEMYCAAVCYYEKHGNLQVPRTFVTDGGNYLLGWLNEQRKKYAKGTLALERIEKLNALGFDWKPIQNRWDFMYELAKQYFRENGDILVPARYIFLGENLGNWITVQRRKYLHPTRDSGWLSSEQIKKLEKLGMVWNVDEHQWEEMFALCERYKLEHGNLRINRNYEIDGKPLGVWIGQQRVRFNRHDGSISDERIKRLESLGMVWDEMQAKWFDYYKLAQTYYHEFGTINIPQKEKFKGKSLGKWLYAQKTKAKDGLLSQEQISLLKQLQLSI